MDELHAKLQKEEEEAKAKIDEMGKKIDELNTGDEK